MVEVHQMEWETVVQKAVAVVLLMDLAMVAQMVGVPQMGLGKVVQK